MLRHKVFLKELENKKNLQKEEFEKTLTEQINRDMHIKEIGEKQRNKIRKTDEEVPNQVVTVID